MSRPRMRRPVAYSSVLVVLAGMVVAGSHARASAGADCGPDPDGLTQCDYYVTDAQNTKIDAGSNSASPTTLTSKPTTLVQTATNHLERYWNSFGSVGMGSVTLNTLNPITDYSPHEGPNISVTITNNNIITWSGIETATRGECPADPLGRCAGTPLGRFAPGESFSVSTTIASQGDGTLGLGARWSSSYGSGLSYAPVKETLSSGPTAAFSTNPITTVPGEYQFVSDSTDPQNEALDQHWDLGDGKTALGPAVTHEYTKPGTYHVKLTVTNLDGKSDSITHDVVVAAPTLSAGLDFVDSTGKVIPTPSPKVGDTVNVRLTLSASEDGVGAVKNIGFTGDPLTLTPSNLTDVTGPTPAIPTNSTLQPGGSASYVYALQVLGAGVVRMTSTPKGVDAVGAAVTTQAAQLSFGISSLQVTITLDPDHFTETQDKSGTKPTDVTVTVVAKNISPDPITDLNIRSISPARTSTGQLLSVAYKSGVKPDPISGYPLDGVTLDPGDSTLPQKTVFTVQSDGKIDFQSLVTGASPLGTTLRGFGTSRLTVKPTKYLEFTSRVVKPGSGLLPAGSPIVISGTVHNLTSSDTLDVGPLYAKLAGNAGVQGLAYNDVGVDPKALTAPGALSLDPGDTKTFTLKVLTTYSEPTGTGGVRRSGGTRADVTFTPWATVTEPDGTKFQTAADGSELLSTDDDLTHRIAIDDSIPIPITSYKVVAGGLMVGAAEGVWNAASGLVTGLITLPSVAASGLLAVTNYQATVWDSFTEAQKQQFADNAASAIVPVLQANLGLAAEGSAKLFNQASAFTYQYFTNMENNWRVGNYAQTVEAYSSLTANALAQVAIPVGLGKLASSTEGVSAVEQSQAALQAKLAAVTSNIDSAETIAKIVPLLTEIASGTEVDAALVEKMFGIAPAELEELQQLATEFRYLLTVRSRAASSIDWIEKFQALVKPEAIKIKSVSALDVKLGYPAKYEGALIFKEPQPLIDLRQKGGQISDLVQAFVEKQGFAPGTPEYYNAINRTADRIAEWNKYAKTYEKWNKQGWVDVSFNWKGNAMADPAIAGRGKYVGFRLNPTGVEGESIVEMYNGNAGRYVPVTGDIDPISFTHLDGSPLTAEEHAALLDKMRTSPLLRAQHGESATYVNGGVDFIESQFKPNEGALQIAPDQATPRIVRFNTKQSIWNSPTDYRLIWDGGFDYAGGSPSFGEPPLNIDYQQLSAPEVPAVPGVALPLPGAGVPNVGRCAMTYSSAASTLPLIMGANGDLQVVTPKGDVKSKLDSICFAEGPIVPVVIKPSTAVATSLGAGITEVPVQSGLGLAGADPNSGFAVGQQVTVGAGTPDAEIGTISDFGSIILAAPLRNAHAAGEVIVVTKSAPNAKKSPPLPATGAPLLQLVPAAALLLLTGGLCLTVGRERKRYVPRHLAR
jgi:PKD repeat protein